jgi:hypothetical protein
MFNSNLADVIDRTKYLHPQFQFAAAVALTKSVKAAQAVMPSVQQSVFDKPTTFTTQGFYTQAARKDNLQAVIGVKDKQAEYLAYQIKGGSRAPKRKALRLPSVVQLNEYGNLPAGLIRQLVARAKAGKRATGSQGKRFGVSTKVDLFYGAPGDGRPAGIYKRVVVSSTRHQLVPVVVFPQRSANYTRRFDFYGEAEKAVRDAFPRELASAWEMALRTAR